MNRNRTLIALVLSAAAAGTAFAESPTVVNDTFVSTKSRAEVQADLAAYKKAGVNPWSTTYNPLRGFKSATTRESVTAAYIASRDEVAALHGEDSGSAYFAQGGHAVPGSATLAGQPARAQ
jgi:hypothetical protein